MPLEDQVFGPRPAQGSDINALNQLFAEAFTDRYRRDGLVGIRVPRLNPTIWEYALANAGEGAMLWHDARGALVAFNMVHCAGRQGWMGPLAVRATHQQMGVGRRIVQAGMARLTSLGARTIGLETMPRTVDNIGFYAQLGFRPGYLTITMQHEQPLDVSEPLPRLSRLAGADRVAALEAVRQLTDHLSEGTDFTREIGLTLSMDLGDVSLLYDPQGDLRGFGLWQHAPLVRGQARTELRVLKLGATDPAAARLMVDGLDTQACALDAMISIRCQSGQTGFFGDLIAAGYRVGWTDLRLTLEGHGEPDPGEGVFLSNWEI